MKEVFADDFRDFKLISNHAMPDDRFIKMDNKVFMSPKNYTMVKRYFKLQATWYGRIWFKFTEFLKRLTINKDKSK